MSSSLIHTAKQKIERLSKPLPTSLFPIALLVLLLAIFAPFIHQLGYFQDDWHHIYYGYSLGPEYLFGMFQVDGRPLAALVYILGFKLLGFRSLNWQLFSLGLRFLTIVFTWMYLKELWPEYKRQVTWVASLFAIYPLFKLQPLSVAYAVHWGGYLLFSVSIWAMIKSLRQPSRYWFYLALALVCGGLDLALIEYFSGLELVRPFLIWFVLGGLSLTRGERVKKTLAHWSPYLLLLLGFLIYRVGIIPSLGDRIVRNPPVLLFDLFKSPFQTGAVLFQTVLQDTFFILTSTWSEAFKPDVLAITQPTNIKILLIALLAVILLYRFLSSPKLDSLDPPGEAPWERSAWWIGLLFLLTGPVPAWLTDQSVSQDNPLWAGRLGMAAIVGASLVIVALLEWLIKDRRARLVVLCCLIAVTASWHLYYTNAYRQSWRKQTSFYYQLSWRAPYIKPHTALLADQEIFAYMGEYPTAFALGTLYPKEDSSTDLNYWFYNALRRFGDNPQDLITGETLSSYNFSQFTADSRDSLVIHYSPEEGQCLWVLTPEDASIRTLPAILRQIAPVSNLSRIEPESRQGTQVPVEIFGPEPKHDWCYAYQKGSLAKQTGDWSEVTRLWREAEDAGYRPQNGVEILPFIEGFARAGDWGTAAALAVRANKLTSGMRHTLCPLWEKLLDDTAAPPERSQTYQEIQDRLGCSE